MCKPFFSEGINEHKNMKNKDMKAHSVYQKSSHKEKKSDSPIKHAELTLVPYF